jgi:hypothetical protein
MKFKEYINESNKTYKESNQNITRVIKGFGLYTKDDSIKQDEFLYGIDEIESFFSSFNLPFHKAVIEDKLNVRFISKNVNSLAKYMDDVDELHINISSPKLDYKSNKYGSLKYAILHELAHRYLNKIKPQSWNIDNSEWITTEYSKVDSWNGQEKFTELFAISYWQDQYKEFSKQIDRFLNMIE